MSSSENNSEHSLFNHMFEEMGQQFKIILTKIEETNQKITTLDERVKKIEDKTSYLEKDKEEKEEKEKKERKEKEEKERKEKDEKERKERKEKEEKERKERKEKEEKERKEKEEKERKEREEKSRRFQSPIEIDIITNRTKDINQIPPFNQREFKVKFIDVRNEIKKGMTTSSDYAILLIFSATSRYIDDIGKEKIALINEIYKDKTLYLVVEKPVSSIDKLDNSPMQATCEEMNIKMIKKIAYDGKFLGHTESQLQPIAKEIREKEGSKQQQKQTTNKHQNKQDKQDKQDKQNDVNKINEQLNTQSSTQPTSTDHHQFHQHQHQQNQYRPEKDRY